MSDFSTVPSNSLRKAQRVVVLRPKPTWQAVAQMIPTSVTALVVTAWLLMLLAPYTILRIAPSYLACLASLVAVRLLVGGADFYRSWTKEATD